MPTLTKPTKDPLNSLLLQPGIAIEHLVNLGGLTVPVVEAVELPDPNQNRVVVTCSSYGAQASQTVELTLEDFLKPFMQLRLTKAQDYDCELLGEDAMDVIGRFDSSSRYRVERRDVEGHVHLHCECKHAAAQQDMFPTIPVLWQLLDEQVHCKHIVRAALEWGIELPGFRLLAP